MGDLSSLITKLSEYTPIGQLPRPTALKFISNYSRFIKTLIKINEMIGIRKLKDQVASQVKSFIVNYRKTGMPTDGEKLNALLCGPPGCGKTHVGKYLAELWTTSGCLSTNQDTSSIFTFTPESRQSILPNITRHIDPELIKLKQTLVLKDSQLRQVNQQLQSNKLFVGQTITMLNNVRKKIHAKDNSKEGLVQHKLQDIKNKLKTAAGYVTGDSEKNDKLLPVIIPSNPGNKSIFGSSNPPILPHLPKLPTIGGSNIDINLITNFLKTSTEEKHVAKFAVITRGDLIGKYQGHTTDQTRKVLLKHIGGVIMIDEVYNLCTGPHDDFGKEALTEINAFMTEHPDKIIFIFAGYKDKIEEHVMKQQPGLARRFNWTFEITEYEPEELCSIFIQQLGKYNRKIDDKSMKDLNKFFKDNVSKFPHFGGDTERFCVFVKEACYENYWEIALDDDYSNEEYKKLFGSIDMEVLKNGFEKYLANSVKESEAIKIEKKKKEDDDIVSRYIS